jgi:hypothetical protein
VLGVLADSAAAERRLLFEERAHSHL